MLLVNVNTKQFIPSAGSNFIQPVESRDQIIYGTRVEVRFQLYNPDGTVFVLNESDTFCCAGDINFIHTDDLMFYSGHEMCRIIDAAQGIVGVTIDATSDSFAGKATSQNTRMHVQLKRHVAGDTLGDTVLQDIVYAQPAVMTTEGAPASSDPEYMTAAATLALLRTAPDYQFSADGETGWHDEQDIAADRFYRERRNGGEWGPAIELIEGKTGPTGAAAGFATPTIAVETLPAGSDATASVTASGDNTAKVFSFNFGIPKGADGQNGTNGADGADGAAGADGVSSYTYVAYASDASGTGFSLTPTNALKYRAEIHTTTAIETPDVDDFTGATWVKYIGDDGAGAGDMTKAVYDTNDDGIVDHAATADAVGATTAAQVADAVGKAHTHANKATLDKLAETDGKLTFDGSEIGGASNWNDITGKPETFPPSAHNHAITDVTGLEDALQNAGTVKSVNGQLPDESGNVTVETGSAVDESRLLPDVSGLTQVDDGKVMQFKFTSAEAGVPFCCNCQTLAPGGNNQLVNESGGATLTMVSIELNQDVEGPFGGASVGGIYYNSMSDGGSVVIQPAPAVDADGDLTLECWLYPGQDTLNYCDVLYAKKSSGGGLAMISFSNGALRIDNKNVIPASAISSLAVTMGKWHHIAISRKNQTTRLFIDGVKVGEGSTAWSILAEEEIKWCFYAAVNGYNNCRCGGFRFSRSGLYEADFAVPTASFSVNAGREMVLDFMQEATSSKAGAMSAADKLKLDSLNITESKARPGYFKLPGGTIVQWGAASNITADGSTQITFPVAFPNAFLIGNATTVSGNASASGVVVSLTAVTVTGMTLIIKNHPGNSNDINVHWLAIGY